MNEYSTSRASSTKMMTGAVVAGAATGYVAGSKLSESRKGKPPVSVGPIVAGVIMGLVFLTVIGLAIGMAAANSGGRR